MEAFRASDVLISGALDLGGGRAVAASMDPTAVFRKTEPPVHNPATRAEPWTLPSTAQTNCFIERHLASDGGRFSNALWHSFSAELEVGTGFGVSSRVGVVRVPIQAVSNYTVNFSRDGVVGGFNEVTEIGVHLPGGTGAGAGIRNTMDSSSPTGWRHESYLGILLPSNARGAATYRAESVDVEFSVGTSVYFIVGGGGNITFNVSEFSRQWNEWNEPVWKCPCC